MDITKNFSVPTTIVTVDINGQTEFTIPFEFLARKFVVVTLIGTDRKQLTLNSDYRFVGANKIALKELPSGDYTKIEIRRVTSATDRLVAFTDGSILRANDMNLAQVQTMHVAEEARDLTSMSLGVNIDGDLDARGRRIVNLGNGVNDYDAVNLGQLRQFDTSTANNADKAKASADSAAASEERCIIAEAKSISSAGTAMTAASDANRSRTESAKSQVAAKESQDAAKVSEDNAKRYSDMAWDAPANSANQLRADLLAQSGASLVSYKGRSVESKLSDMVSVKDFPWSAKGDASTDDTSSIQAADDWCAQNGKTLYFPDGVYRCSNGITKRALWKGNGAARVGTFPLFDDKQFMTPTTKHKLPGSNLLFTGSGTLTATTLRTDSFSSVRPCVKALGRGNDGLRCGRGIDGIGIICDFDFRVSENGEITLPNNDNSADYDVGLWLENIDNGELWDVTVGGYFKKAGIVHYGADPDHTHMHGVRTMGDIGLAVVGDSTGTNSGLHLFGCFIGANDHHSRSADPTNERWGRTALYIDIPSSSSGGSRNGINMHGGTIYTKRDITVELDRCGAINFFGTIFENATQQGSALAGGTKRMIGTQNTGDVSFISCRLNSDQIYGDVGLLRTATDATVNVIGSNRGYGIESWVGTRGFRVRNSSGVAKLQLSDDPKLSTTGVNISYDSAGTMGVFVGNDRKLSISNDGVDFIKYNRKVATVNNGTLPIASSIVRVSGGIQDITRIESASNINRVLLIPNTSSDKFTLKSVTGGGNIRGAGLDVEYSGFVAIELVEYAGFWRIINVT